MYPLVAQFGISSPYGPRPKLMGDFHYGTDMPCPIGTDIPCVKEGTVVMADWIYFTVGGTNYKELVCIVNRPDGRFNIYDHLSQVFVKKGDKVNKGQIIAKSGASGFVTGPHLHLQQSIGQYTGGLFANYKTEDPEPELRAWTLQGGSIEDMDTHQIARDLYQTFTGQVPGDDIINQKADYMTATGNIQQVAKDLLAAGIETNPIPNRWALSIYDAARGGSNPDQFATDRLIGGTNFRQVMNGDIPTYVQRARDADSLDAKLAAATVDAFKQAYLTRAGDYPTKDQVADWQHSQADIPSWVNAHAPSKSEAELQRQVDQLTTNIGTLQTTTQQALKHKDTTIGQLQAKIDGKPYVAPVEETPVGDGGIIFSPDPKPEKKQGSFLSWVIDIIKALGGSK